MTVIIVNCSYFMLLFVTITDTWKAFSIPALLFIGAKSNAIFFYHYMEFTSDIPPENLGAYFSVEGPYILSMMLVVLKVMVAVNREEPMDETTTHEKND